VVPASEKHAESEKSQQNNCILEKDYDKKLQGPIFLIQHAFLMLEPLLEWVEFISLQLILKLIHCELINSA
jgi:hypothetical protein